MDPLRLFGICSTVGLVIGAISAVLHDFPLLAMALVFGALASAFLTKRIWEFTL